MKVKINNKSKSYRTVWFEKGIVKLIDQPKLPFQFGIHHCKDYKECAEAIQTMIVRGAPAIGATAAYATAQAALKAPDDGFDEFMQKAAAEIKAARPTAVDLAHGVDRVMKVIKDWGNSGNCGKLALEEADMISEEYVEACKKIGENGNKLIQNGDNILTHCNAGWLACVDWGTAIAPIYFANRSGRDVFVWVDETRPRCQGARLTAWELAQENIKHAVIADNAAGFYMQRGDVDLCIVGSDRTAANGDVANKIGTYERAVVAKENGIPFYVAIPKMTYDPNCPSGKQIPIEERDEEEVTHMWGDSGRIRITNPSSHAKNPAFDVTPAKYVTSYITEAGVLKASELREKL